jgi:hypothetical protein
VRGIHRQGDRHSGLPHEHHRLAVMIGDQLGELVQAVGGGALQPGRDLRVQADALGTRQCSVGDVAEEDVAEGVQTAFGGHDQVAGEQATERRVEILRRWLRWRAGDGLQHVQTERAPGHRGRLQHSALGGGQTIQPLQHGLVHRVGQAVGGGGEAHQAALSHRARQLDSEEWVAARTLADALAHGLVQSLGQVAHQLACLLVTERLKLQ